jgi:hypothetical protein
LQTQEICCDLDQINRQIYMSGKCKLQAIPQRKAKAENISISRSAVWTVEEKDQLCVHKRWCVEQKTVRQGHTGLIRACAFPIQYIQLCLGCFVHTQNVIEICGKQHYLGTS